MHSCIYDTRRTVIAICCQYEKVETYDGEPVSVLKLLQYIRGVASEFLIHRLLTGASSEAIDKESQFYLTYRWTYLDNTVPYDDARKIATAEGVDLEQLWREAGFVKKTGANVSVMGPVVLGNALHFGQKMPSG